MTAKALVVGLAALCATAHAAQACQKSGHAQLDDDFKNPDPGWGQADNVAAFTREGLVLTPPAGGSAWRSNSNYTLRHADWCIRVTSPLRLPDPADETAVGAVGVWFWAQDPLNFYTATITLDGNASVDRLYRGAWQVVVAPAYAASVKTAPGATNEIEIVTDDGTATFYVNGLPVTQVTGRPPDNGGAPGLYAESGPNGTSWIFARATLY